jgi:hypothetical protein
MLIDPTRFCICWWPGKQVFHLFNSFLCCLVDSLLSSGIFNGRVLQEERCRHDSVGSKDSSERQTKFEGTRVGKSGCGQISPHNPNPDAVSPPCFTRQVVCYNTAATSRSHVHENGLPENLGFNIATWTHAPIRSYTGRYQMFPRVSSHTAEIQT